MNDAGLEIVVVLLLIPLARPILPDRDLDALSRETLAQRRALDHAGEALRGVDGEHFGKAGCEDGGFARVDGRHGAWRPVGGCWRGGHADVDEREAESIFLLSDGCWRGEEWLGSQLTGSFPRCEQTNPVAQTRYRSYHPDP